MSRRNQNALQTEAAVSESQDTRSSEVATNKPAEEKKEKDSFLKISMLMWGFPIFIFATILILRDCLNLF